MNDRIEFFFDVGSPAAYLAWTQLPRLARDTGCAIDYKPMLLGGVFQATGNRSPMEVPVKGTYVMRDPQRYALKDQGGILEPAHIADNYWHLHTQPRDAWTFELDLRPYMERW